VALTIAQALIYLLAKHAGLTVNAQRRGHPDGPRLRRRDGLRPAAGRPATGKELRRHADRHEAMAVALQSRPVRRSSRAPVRSSPACLCLMIAETNSTAGLGPVLAIGVVVALAVMMTLLPAHARDRRPVDFSWPARPTVGSAEPTTRRAFWARVGNAHRTAATHHLGQQPRSCWAIMAVGIVQLDANGLTNKESFRGKPGRRRRRRDSVAPLRRRIRYGPSSWSAGPTRRQQVPSGVSLERTASPPAA